MCGIVGFTGSKNNKLLAKMLKLTRHRGPDEKIVFFGSGINVGMNRLSIIDLRKNLYPMKYKDFILLYNGEIYNFQILKKQLQKKKVRFKTSSDAEIILPLFALYGPKAFSMLEGMFAIFIYDKKNKIIYLARDKMGEKPLYYYQKKGFLAFSSELKALLVLLKPKLKLKNILIFLRQSYIPAPQTIIQNIKKVPSSHYLEYRLKNNHSKLKSYWSINKLTETKQKPSHSKLINKLDYLINKSIGQKLIADVPVGCFLSGGLDSSLVTAIASQHKNNLHTFSIAFPGFKNHDESAMARLAAKLCRTRHTEITCTAQKIRPIIENIGGIIDEPIIDAAILPLYLLAQEAVKKIKVVLTGDGADELFIGYPRHLYEFILEKARNKLSFLPTQILPLLPHKIKYRLSSSLYQHYLPQEVWNQKMLDKLINRNLLKNASLNPLPNHKYKHREPLLFMQKVDLTTFLPEQMMMKTDKITMFHSLEARSPYLDSHIIKFALTLPEHFKINLFRKKYLLKKVAEGYLPAKIVWRKKHYFSVPLSHWFRHQLKDIVYESISDVEKYLPSLNHNYYQQIVEDHLREKADYNYPIWGMIVLTKFLKYHQFSLT